MSNVDIEKLEQLSCLKLEKEHKKEFEESIKGVFEMLLQIDKIQVTDNKILDKTPTILAEDEISSNYLFDKNQESNSLNIVDSFFLAPKVISKD